MEQLPIVNELGDIIGSATRTECHAHTFLLHPVVHLHVFNPDGELYLQLRSQTKTIQPGKWDTAVGGHVDTNESVEEAMLREAREELGLTGFQYKLIRSYKFVSSCEAELVYVYQTVCTDIPVPDPEETDGGRFWSLSEIRQNIGKGLFTPNFEQEFQQIIDPTHPNLAKSKTNSEN